MSIFFLIFLQYAAGFFIETSRNKIEIYIYAPLNEFVCLLKVCNAGLKPKFGPNLAIQIKVAIVFRVTFFSRRKGPLVLNFWTHAWVTKRIWSMVRSHSPDPLPLHIALCCNSSWNGPIYNFFSFWATERLFISKWGRISPESDWCLFCDHFHYFSGGIWTFPLLSVTYAS